MDYRNATYNQVGTIDLEIDHPDRGWIPFTASPDDPEPFGRAVYEEIKDIPIAPYVAPPPARQMVQKSVVQARIMAAGKMGDAYAVLTTNPIYFARWFAPDRPVVYCDDPDAVALVQALGLDPIVILAAG
ncbi:hypothetical protein [Mesorhizobium sp.]|uniref:hypothetical protein n=1 Tax=Mesorhizobium sp. TaxID=1871066 RepID=UPI0012245598|nr:hypothetical protein [Mesorhizobium sp.]TJV19701.1 MAG: hypothetical protein E5Y07_00475 [Mesorhizobium sp.]